MPVVIDRINYPLSSQDLDSVAKIILDRIKPIIALSFKNILSFSMKWYGFAIQRAAS